MSSRPLYHTGGRREHRIVQCHKLHQKTMTTLSNYGRHLKTIRFQFDPAGEVITQRFCTDTFKMLNKNLIFVPTQKKLLIKIH